MQILTDIPRRFVEEDAAKANQMIDYWIPVAIEAEYIGCIGFFVSCLRRIARKIWQNL